MALHRELDALKGEQTKMFLTGVGVGIAGTILVMGVTTWFAIGYLVLSLSL